MKTVKVTFPDGSTRDVPARERLVPDNQIPPGNPRFELEPAYDPDWEFFPVIGDWRARERR